MKSKKSKLLIGVFALALSVFAVTKAFAEVDPGIGDCSPNATFWGERCCVYTVENPPYISSLVQKCCDYRFWINFGCESTAVLP